MYALVLSCIVIEIVSKNALGKYHPSILVVPCDETVQVGWSYAGDVFSPPVVPELTPEDLQEEIIESIQAHLDAFAKTRNYDSSFAAATYASSTNEKFRIEGQYFVEARDAIWLTCYRILDDVYSGQRPMPSTDDIIAELPPLAWPEVQS